MPATRDARARYVPAPAEEPPDPARRLVIEGNKAWQAAAEVRKRWLADELFARRAHRARPPSSSPGSCWPCPSPCAPAWPSRPGRMGFSRGHPAGRGEVAGDLRHHRRGPAPLLMLAPIAVTYEHAMTQNEGRNTWRTDTATAHAPAPRPVSTWPSWPAPATQLTPIEQAVPTASPGPATSACTLTGQGDDPAGDGEPDPDGSGNWARLPRLTSPTGGEQAATEIHPREGRQQVLLAALSIPHPVRWLQAADNPWKEITSGPLRD